MERVDVTLNAGMQLIVAWQGDGGLPRMLPVREYRSFSTSYLCGDEQQILFELEITDEVQTDGDDVWLLRCVRCDVQEVEYHNELEEPLWVCNGVAQSASHRIDPGQSLILPFRPDPPLPRWQIPSRPEQEQWKELSLPDFLGMNTTPEQEDHTIPWNRVSAYTVFDGKVCWFEKSGRWDSYRRILPEDIDDGDDFGPVRFSAQQLKRMQTYTIAWQGEWAYSSNWRRPLIWMRGRTVTPEQALAVVRRTDGFFTNEGKGYDHVFIQMLYSDWFRTGTGWCRPDGHIGWDGISSIKYPDDDEILRDGFQLMQAFPFLDLFFLFWDCEETQDFTPGRLAMHGMPLPQFGVRFHDRRIEMFCPRTAWEMFCDFQIRYGDEPETYACENLSVGEVDREYLDRCLRANGLDPENFDWKGRTKSWDRCDQSILALQYQTLKEACVRRREEITADDERHKEEPV